MSRTRKLQSTSLCRRAEKRELPRYNVHATAVPLDRLVCYIRSIFCRRQSRPFFILRKISLSLATKIALLPALRLFVKGVLVSFPPSPLRRRRFHLADQRLISNQKPTYRLLQRGRSVVEGGWRGLDIRHGADAILSCSCISPPNSIHA